MKEIPDLSSPYIALKQLVADLRDPTDGCPWDIEQTHQSIRENLIEEAYEAMEAVESYSAKDLSSIEDMKEELGDLLFQVVFHARMAEERSEFSIDDMFRSCVEKLVSRHPHVYQNTDRLNSETVLINWESIKRSEKKKKSREHLSMLSGIPRSMPALLKAYRMGHKISRVNFDWMGPEKVNQLLEKIDEEQKEMLEQLPKDPELFNGNELPDEIHVRKERATEEIGDLLFVIAQLARHYYIDPEYALQRANDKFQSRFQKMEEHFQDRLEKNDLPSLDEWEEKWQKVKKDETLNNNSTE